LWKRIEAKRGTGFQPVNGELAPPITGKMPVPQLTLRYIESGFMTNVLDQLLDLSHRIGTHGGLAILGEGNTSAKVDGDRMLVKASGFQLATLPAEGVTQCSISRLMAAVDGPAVVDGRVDELLLESRLDLAAKKPSVEAYFHAYLLTLPGVQFVAHCHPNLVNAILCAPLEVRERFARQRQCPDEVVCCGAESLLLPYVDPGLTLARELREGVRGFVGRTGKPPKVILLGNHGIICPSSSVAGAWAALTMAVKAAEVFLGAMGLGGAVPLPAEDVARLDGRPDEAYRRAILGI
jgi:rhamnose utilization protein RhaD (predicted bifunctional aldolase and dehydrogenase)